METRAHTFVIGEDVSMGFNGDWYHVGQVVRITKKFLFTSTGRKFSLRAVKDVDSDGTAYIQEYFRESRGYFVLAHGIHKELNPHF